MHGRLEIWNVFSRIYTRYLTRWVHSIMRFNFHIFARSCIIVYVYVMVNLANILAKIHLEWFTEFSYRQAWHFTRSLDFVHNFVTGLREYKNSEMVC